MNAPALANAPTPAMPDGRLAMICAAYHDSNAQAVPLARLPAREDVDLYESGADLIESGADQVPAATRAAQQKPPTSTNAALPKPPTSTRAAPPQPPPGPAQPP